MRSPCKVRDRGLLPGPHHVALDRELASSAQAELHFGRYRPTASVGAFERIEQAVRAGFCRIRGIGVVRRPTGGGALYLDPGQLCWTLSLPKAAGAATTLAELNARHLRAVATALDGLGVAARIKAPNDIEVEGRKLASVFITTTEQAVLFQGTLLLAVEVETLLRVLRVPMEKLSAEGVQSARERFVTLCDLGLAEDTDTISAGFTEALAAEFGFAPKSAPSPEPPTPEPAPADLPLPENAHYAFLRTAGGVLHAWVRLDAAGETIEAAALSGSFHATPTDLLRRCEATLTGAPVAGWRDALAEAVAGADWLGLDAGAITAVIDAAIRRREAQQALGLERDEANTLMIHGGRDAEAIAAEATVMLVPYCAKPPECSWRHRDGCPECGLCEVGEAYRLARERGMRVVSITRFEHLQETLESMQREGVPAYVGMCCQSFYVKRHYAFEQAGIPALLMDISGANCYELQQEDLAYAGRFEARAYLNAGVVEKVMRLVPIRTV